MSLSKIDALRGRMTGDGAPVPSVASVGSIASVLAVGSIASLACVGSIASVASVGSIASINSIGSIASRNQVGAIFNIPVAEKLAAALTRRLRAHLAARR